ncbi:hypothetical protein FEE39_00775 [Lactobacillus johnsonii]|uniref:Uncharacterized protein n=1 Tax=Lactobacillus johnsonii TaxID=33959 RepID=A0A9X7XTG8_LACJH|nr:hypothetical protein FEE39_00775 [Lactobacillus johnsonii]
MIECKESICDLVSECCVGNYILSNRSRWTFLFFKSVQLNFTIGLNLCIEAIAIFLNPLV